MKTQRNHSKINIFHISFPLYHQFHYNNTIFSINTKQGLNHI